METQLKVTFKKFDYLFMSMILISINLPELRVWRVGMLHHGDRGLAHFPRARFQLLDGRIEDTAAVPVHGDGGDAVGQRVDAVVRVHLKDRGNNV